MVRSQFCAGCGLCAQICSRNAVTMVCNPLGFYVPEVDLDHCIQCGLCDKLCPQDCGSNPHSVTCTAVSCRSLEERLAASSGGVFGLMAKDCIYRGGVVYGVVFQDGVANTERAETIKQVKAMHGAKYVQAKAWEAYSEVKKDLINDRCVLFSGTPCQIAALRGYLKKDYEKLICVEIGCHGVPSSEMLQSYLQSLGRCSNGKYGLHPEVISFRDKQVDHKTISWKDYNVHFKYSSGEEYRKYFRKDPYMKAFFNDLSINPACFRCPFKIYNSRADVTIADFWGIDRIHPEWDDDTGISLVIAHTEKGQEMGDRIKKECTLWEQVPDKVALSGNPFLVNAPVLHEKQGLFFENYLSGMDWAENINLCLKKSLVKRIWNKLKRILHCG